MPIGGKQRCYGFNNLVNGWTGDGADARLPPQPDRWRRATAAELGFKSTKNVNRQRRASGAMSKISGKQYADLFGPTTGDKIRLGDTDLYVEIEKDLRVYGDEAIYGGGKTLRDGMGSDNQLTSAAGASTWSSPT